MKKTQYIKSIMASLLKVHVARKLRAVEMETQELWLTMIYFCSNFPTTRKRQVRNSIKCLGFRNWMKVIITSVGALLSSSLLILLQLIITFVVKTAAVSIPFYCFHGSWSYLFLIIASVGDIIHLSFCRHCCVVFCCCCWVVFFTLSWCCRRCFLFLLLFLPYRAVVIIVFVGFFLPYRAVIIVVFLPCRAVVIIVVVGFLPYRTLVIFVVVYLIVVLSLLLLLLLLLSVVMASYRLNDIMKSLSKIGIRFFVSENKIVFSMAVNHI